MKPYLLAAALSMSLLSILPGCGEAPPPTANTPAEISRAGAVDAARQDAALRFRVVDVSAVAVSRSGRYWVVDLRTRDGGGVHYAIAGDGTIRERRMMQ
ncbi:hypothetical protein A7982_12866 [Minicystis rosea]|nr:hypothetical protein A7982_12866 [Minicystis rosea]